MVDLKFCYRCLVASIWSVKRDSKNKIDRIQCACGCHVFVQGGRP